MIFSNHLYALEKFLVILNNRLSNQKHTCIYDSMINEFHEVLNFTERSYLVYNLHTKLDDSHIGKS